MGEWARNEIKRKRKIAVRTELLLVNSAQTNIKYIILSIVCKCNPPNSFVFVSIRSVDRLNKTATRNKMQWTNGKRWETRKIKKFFFSSVVVAVRRSSSTVTFIACVYTVFSECRRFFIWTSHRPMRPGQPERDSFFFFCFFYFGCVAIVSLTLSLCVVPMLLLTGHAENAHSHAIYGCWVVASMRLNDCHLQLVRTYFVIV